jgi:hypothetical protein
MLPRQLQAEQFSGYPPEARELAVASLGLLRQMPTILVASLLREVIGYDWKFSAERRQIDGQLRYCASLSPGQLRALFAGFEQIHLDSALLDMDWVKDPMLFSERLTAYLWSSHQIDAFRAAATQYAVKMSQVTLPEEPKLPRLGLAVIGQGVEKAGFSLFRKLRPYGVHFTQVDPENGLQILVDEVRARAAEYPIPFGHWYIDGGAARAAESQVTTVSYEALQPLRNNVLKRMQQVIQSGSGGPELMESTLATISPEELGMSRGGQDGLLDHFEVSLFTQGSGTQIFSTTFVMWAAREAMRRAEPVTLLAHFTPRQRQRPMNELIEGKSTRLELDPPGSLLDADMAAYYTWLDQQRLSHADESSFLVWFEGHNEVLAIAPGLPRGTESSSAGNLRRVLTWIS